MFSFIVYIIALFGFLLVSYIFLTRSTQKMMKMKLKEVGVQIESEDFGKTRVMLAIMLLVIFGLGVYLYISLIL